METANGTAKDQQRLIYSGRVLKDGDKLAEYAIKVQLPSPPTHTPARRRLARLTQAMNDAA